MARPAASARPRIEIVLEAARSEFLKNGFSETSVDALALRAGVSKATIYRHYKNKQEILEAVIHTAVQAAPVNILGQVTEKTSPERMLKHFANTLLKSVSDKESIAMFRLVISESHRLPHLGQFFFDEITAVAAAPLANYLKKQSRGGDLRIPDAHLAAFQFIGMIKEPLFWPLLMGVEKSSIRPSQSKVINSAVRGFIRQYETN